MPRLSAEEKIADRINLLPGYWWSVDPGDRNVGVSWWSGAVCIRSYHTDPNDCVDTLVHEIQGGLEFLVYEQFTLRGYQMGEQQGSEFLTSQLIGAMRHICRRAKVSTASYQAGNHKPTAKKMEFRPPMRTHGEWVSFGEGPHAKDSECLGEYHVRTVILKGRGF
jgi:hypothetical protein